MLQNRLFFLWRRVVISDAVAPSSIVLCNSVFAARIVVAGSRLLGAAAACVILLFFPAGHCKSYWNGCIKAAIVIFVSTLSQFWHLWFSFHKSFSKVLQNHLFSLWRRDLSGFGAAISDTIAPSSIVFCNSVSADRIVMAASRLLGAAAACVIILSFAAGHRKSYWSGCIKAAIVICQQIFSV